MGKNLNSGIVLMILGLGSIILSLSVARTSGLSALQYSAGLGGLAVLCFGIAQYHFPLALPQRIIIAKRAFITGAAIILAALVLSAFHFHLSYFLLLPGFFVLAFTYIPLLSRNRLDKWRRYTRREWHTYMLAYSDLLSLTTFTVGLLFKLSNWPGANLLLITGFSILIVTMFGWNKLFSREVVLRKEAEEKISAAYDQLNLQAEKIKEKNAEILDSITYANRIQQALLTREGLFSSCLPGHFIYYQPKDIVAGDFYWGAPTRKGFIYITADCTGHGVPGAFMSLLNISKLNEYIVGKELHRPEQILNHIRGDIVQILNAGDKGTETKDGMDCVLIHLDLEERTLSYAAANNNFYIVRDGKLLNFEADKMPVGKFENERSFTYREVSLLPSDMIYTFTDGFADQFGGPRGKKFKYRQFESALLSVAHLDPATQRLRLKETFESWKGDMEQVDDVCVIGVRVQ